MKRRSVSLLCCLLVLAMNVSPIFAQTEFRKALQEKYNFKSVSCYTCHERVKLGTENPKQYRNDFGKEFDKLLKGKNVTARLDEVKGLDSEDPKKTKVQDEVTKEFLEALQKVIEVKSSSGETYGELLKNATLDGVKAAE